RVRRTRSGSSGRSPPDGAWRPSPTGSPWGVATRCVARRVSGPSGHLPTARGGGFRSEAARLFAVPAGGHVAPAARLVSGAVIEGPAAGTRAAQFQPLPLFGLHRRVHGGDQPADRSDGA